MKYFRVVPAILCVLACIVLAGCGMAGQKYFNSEEERIRSYVEATLDNSYKNDSKLFVKMGIGTAKEAKELYEQGLELEIAELAAVYNGDGELVNVGEEDAKKWREAMAKALASVKYSVNSAAPGDDGTYIVSVSYEQAELFRITLTEYQKRLDDLRAELEEQYTDALAYNTAVMRIYRDCFEYALEHLTYKEKQNIYVTVSQNDEGTYEIDDQELFSLESLFLDIDFADRYPYDLNRDPGVEVGKYKGIEVEKNEVDFSAEDVFAAIYTGLADLREDTDRTTVELYDFVLMDFTVKLAATGELLSDEKDYELCVGSGSTVEGLEEQLIGHSVGETVEFTLVYPEDHLREQVAGKEAAFVITIKGIKAVPELTDELIAENTEFEGFTELWNYVADEIKGMAEEETENRFRRAVLEAIIADSKFDSTLESEVENCKNDVLSVYKEQARMYSMTFEEFVEAAFGMEMEDFYLSIDQDSLFQVQVERVLFAIALKEGIAVSDDEVETFISTNMDSYGYESRDEVIADYGMGYIMRLIMQDKALELVLGTAIIK